jgi:hypothetical protein
MFLNIIRTGAGVRRSNFMRSKVIATTLYIEHRNKKFVLQNVLITEREKFEIRLSLIQYK